MSSKTIKILLFSILSFALLGSAGIFSFLFFNKNSGAIYCPPNPPQPWIQDCQFYKTVFNSTTDPNYPIVYDYGHIPTTMQLGKSYKFTAQVSIKVKMPNLYNNGDIFGISLSKVLQSPKGTNLNVNMSNVTVGYLSANRGNRPANIFPYGNDLQQGVDLHGNPIAAKSRWDNYQCQGSEVYKANYNVGDSVTVSCTFTPTSVGFYQVDVNSWVSYNYTPPSRYPQNCDQNYCGALMGTFIKVIDSTPVPTTPVPTTPIPTTPAPTQPSKTPPVTKTPTPRVSKSPTPPGTTVPVTTIPITTIVTSTITSTTLISTTSPSPTTASMLACNTFIVTQNGTAVTGPVAVGSSVLTIKSGATSSAGNVNYSAAQWTISPATPALTVSADSSSATWTPPTDTSQGNTFTVSVTGITDSANNTIASPCMVTITLATATLPNTAGITTTLLTMIAGLATIAMGILLFLREKKDL